MIKWEPLADEPFLIVFDKRWLKDARRDHPGMGIYFPLEMRELSRHKHDVEFLRILHQTKKEFRGWIVPSSSPEYVPFEELGKR